MEKETLYDLWAKKDVFFESGFYNTIIEDYCQYKGGSSESQTLKGKTFNAGYEIFIYAFFLGLYAGERRPLVGSTQKFGQPVGFWGNVTQKGRHPYGKIRQYIFAALVVKSDIDFIALEKGESTAEDAVRKLINTMEEYANAGFYLMNEKMQSVPDFFYESQGFLNYLLKFCSK